MFFNYIPITAANIFQISSNWNFLHMLFLSSFVDEVAREKLAPYLSLSGDESYQSRDLEKVCWSSPRSDGCWICVTSSWFLIVANLQATQQVAKQLYDAKVQPSTLIPKQVGNMYTASLYAAFSSLLHNKNSSLVKALCISFFNFHYFLYLLFNC